MAIFNSYVSLPEGLTILGPPLSLEFWPPPPDTPKPPDTPDTRLGTRRQGPGPAMAIPEPLWKYQGIPWKTGFSWVLYHWKYGFHGFRNETRFETIHGYFHGFLPLNDIERSLGKPLGWYHWCLMIDSDWWFGTWLLFFHILGIIIPIANWLIFFRGVETTNQILDAISRY
jgi:hypothetical protein